MSCIIFLMHFYLQDKHLTDESTDLVAETTYSKHDLITLYLHGGLMVSELDSGSSGPGLSPGRERCIVFMGKTLNPHSASLHPGV